MEHTNKGKTDDKFDWNSEIQRGFYSFGEKFDGVVNVDGNTNRHSFESPLKKIDIMNSLENQTYISQKGSLSKTIKQIDDIDPEANIIKPLGDKIFC